MHKSHFQLCPQMNVETPSNICLHYVICAISREPVCFEKISISGIDNISQEEVIQYIPIISLCTCQ